ncbi:MAG: FISUMP domain-containing protein [Bacteroidales bacterium]
MRIFATALVVAWSILSLAGQDISISFTGTGEAILIDSVNATNLRTGESITLPGDEILRLVSNSGILLPEEPAGHCLIFPNPFPGSTTLAITVNKPQTVNLSVSNLLGQTVAISRAAIPAGENQFGLALSLSGIYSVSLETERGVTSRKVICTSSGAGRDQISYLGQVSGYFIQPDQREVKALNADYFLGFEYDDIVLFRCYSGRMVTLKSDSPKASGTLTVGFASCADGAGVNYPIIKIGTQTWMAQNLSYLPAVGPPNVGSDTEKHYYVYGYSGTSVAEAQGTDNYKLYGALYNWPAALDGNGSSSEVPSGVRGICPEGWHLPSDDEWKILEIHLGMSESDADEIEWRDSGDVGKKLKSSTGWYRDGNGDNSSGFTALPAGCRYNTGVFDGRTYRAYFWSATEIFSSPRSRNLDFLNNGAGRSYYTKRSGFSVRCIRDYNVESLPSVTTEGFSDLKPNSVRFNGRVTDDGSLEVTARGVCWSTSENPTLGNSHTIDGSGLGSFNSEIGGLDKSTTYYVRAYATNSLGTDYGNQVRFGTPEGRFTDGRDGQDYNWIRLGEQEWMSQNLAYLPSVSHPDANSDTEMIYYVYGYEGDNVADAKATENYSAYGVLYNWPAALNGANSSSSVPSGVKGLCPEGWHLPSEGEWNQLKDYLIDNGFAYPGTGDGIAKSLASTSGWQFYSSTPGTVGYDQETNNSTGFDGLPAGKRVFDGHNGIFSGEYTEANFWTSSIRESDNRAGMRGLYKNWNYLFTGYSQWFSAFSIRCVKN